MIPPALSAVAFHILDLGRHVGEPQPKIVAAAVFSSRVEGNSVFFSLQAVAPHASDPDATLLRWLDEQLDDKRAVLAGYRLRDTSRLLEQLDLARWSSGVRALGVRGHRTLIDVHSYGPAGEELGFEGACARRGMPAPGIGEDALFSAWMCGRWAALQHTVEVNAISLWRIVMRGLAQQTPLGRATDRHIEAHLADWLAETGSPATRLHHDSLAATRA